VVDGEERLLSLYEIVKFIHVLLAIIAVGFNASYGVWLARAARNPEHEGHVPSRGEDQIQVAQREKLSHHHARQFSPTGPLAGVTAHSCLTLDS
jgi:hypothetical protein